MKKILIIMSILFLALISLMFWRHTFDKVEASRNYKGDASFVTGNTDMAFDTGHLVKEIAIDGADNLWAVSFEGDSYPWEMVITRYDTQGNNKKDFHLKGNYRDSCSGLIFDSAGSAWILTPTVLTRFALESGQYKNFDIPETKFKALETVDTKLIQAMAYDGDNRLWLARYNSKAFTTFDIDKGQFQEEYVADDFGGAGDMGMAQDDSIWMNVVWLHDDALVGGLKVASYRDGKIDYFDYGVTGLAVKGNDVWLARSDGNEEDPSHKLTKLNRGKEVNYEVPYQISFNSPMSISPGGDVWLPQGTDVGRLLPGEKRVDIYKIPKFYGRPYGSSLSSTRTREKDFGFSQPDKRELDPMIKDFLFDSKGNVWFLASSFGKIGKITPK